MSKELYEKLVCALTHNISTCHECGKCKGEDGVAIRLELIRELAAISDFDLPWDEDVTE